MAEASAATPQPCLMCGAACLEKIGAVPVCLSCQPTARRFPLPRWLSAAALALAALLAVELAWSARYWGPARAYLLGRRAAEAGDWAAASKHLATALKGAPDSEPALLLRIKSDLLSGDPGAAYQGIARFGDKQTDDPLINDINAILTRVDQAATKANAAAGAKTEAEALALFEEASRLYPESRGISAARDVVRATKLFEAGDYLGCADAGKRLFALQPASSQIAFMVASGLSAEYARSGDAARAAEARAWIVKGLALAGPERATAGIDAARLEHRLRSRKIMTREEYVAAERAGSLP